MWIRIRAVIVEDEPLAAEYLATLLDETCQVEVVGTAAESEAGLRLCAEEFATYYPLGDLMRWLGGDPFIQAGRHAIVNLRAIEQINHSGDRLYRVQLRDRLGTQITASRTGAARLAAVVNKQQR
jgi:DNA-binding LytR/AlgR family response regulator